VGTLNALFIAQLEQDAPHPVEGLRMMTRRVARDAP
jgi:hypothetical protein